jgi:alpha-tubulin suppressor-like RCC1 family protein
MLTMDYRTSSIKRICDIYSRLFSLVLVLLLLALPAVSRAATPWYSYGKSHTLTLTEDGKVWALGGNEFGQLGNGTFGGETLEPRLVKGLDGIVAVYAGSNHSVALKKDGSVWAWGSNDSGQLGDGTSQNSSVPHQVSGISNVKAIATGSGHIVALKQDGTVWAWGGNRSGQLGIGGYQDRKTPVQVAGLGGVTAIVAGAFNSSALKKDGTLLAWGFNGSGQLGTGDNERSSTPVMVAGLENVRAVAAGDYHVVAVKQDGTVWAWGSNRASQLGTTTASYSSSPRQVPGISNITDITASVGHTIAIAKNNTVWAWGDAGTGQWGNGLSMDGSVAPVMVSSYNGPVTVAALVNPDSVQMVGSTMRFQADVDSSSTIAQIKQPESFIIASR